MRRGRPITVSELLELLSAEDVPRDARIALDIPKEADEKGRMIDADDCVGIEVLVFDEDLRFPGTPDAYVTLCARRPVAAWLIRAREIRRPGEGRKGAR